MRVVGSSSRWGGWRAGACALALALAGRVAALDADRRPDQYVHTAFAARDGNNFGPTGTVEAFRRKGIGSVVFRMCCRDVAADDHDEMLIRGANFMYYARAFACPIHAVWKSAKDLTQNGAIKKAK